jgi:precorrin-3B methylase
MRSSSSSQRIGSGAKPDPGSQAQDRQRDRGGSPGRVSIVSLGPGSQQFLAPAALEALAAAEVVVGYKLYLELIRDLIEGKEVLASGMRKEVERCAAALDAALAGQRVALVSSGDAGIYGMAGLVFDLCRERNLRVVGPAVAQEIPAGGDEQSVEHTPEEVSAGVDDQADEGAPPSAIDLFIEVIPGVPAFNAAAAVLGAPLMHDFAAVSLSDHLTPWELIEKRLAAAAAADFVLAIYNPRSKTRPHGLQRALQLLLEHRPAATPVGIVRRAMRDGQWRQVTTLGAVPIEEVDMQSVLIIGNSKTYLWRGWMVTPRGYLDKYTAEGGLAGEGE